MQQQVGGLVRQAIELCRQKLLDLSNRNRVINFKHSESSSRHIRIADEIPELLFEKLLDGTSLEFAAVDPPELIAPDENTVEFKETLKAARENDEGYRSEVAALGLRPRKARLRPIERSLRDRVREKLRMPPWRLSLDVRSRARELGINPTYDLPSNTAELAARHSDDKLQTLFFPDDLDSKLSSILHAADSLMKDAGINALYCTFGFLEWYESIDSADPHFAPLIFVPVDMTKTPKAGQIVFAIRGRDEDVSINVTLAELLRREHGLELPNFDEDGGGLESYLARIAQLCANKPRWTVKHWVTVGISTFAKLVMWKDLDAARWPIESQPHEHHLTRSIFAGEGAHESTIAWADDHDIDRPEIAARVPSLITDADVSQHSAIVDVMDGRSLVIQGPPGTGKSQTITNIIASAIYSGKTVLFVSEKMAALEVVRNRLEKAGIGDFCLEVHSTKTSRSQVLQSLKRRIELVASASQATAIEQAKHAISNARERLTGYVRRMNEPAGETGLSVNEVLGKNCTQAELPQDVPIAIRSVRFDNVLSIDPFARQEMIRRATAVEEQCQKLGQYRSPLQQPWRGIGNPSLTRFDRDRVIEVTSNWLKATEALISALQALSSESGWTSMISQEAAEQVVLQIRQVPTPPIETVWTLLPGLRGDAGRLSARELIRSIGEACKLRSSISAVLPPNEALVLGPSWLETLASSASSHGLTDASLPTIRDRISSLQANILDINKATAFIEKTCALAGVPGVQPTVPFVNCLSRSITHLRQLPKSLLRYRTTELSTEDAVDSLRKGLALGRDVTEARRSVGDGALLDDLPNSRELKDAALVVANYGLFSRLFSREYKAAKRQFRQIMPRAKLRRAEISRTLQAAALYVESKKRFDDFTPLRAICGRFYDGLATPFDDLISIAEWMVQVRHVAPVSVEGSDRIKSFLRFGEIDRVDSVIQIAEVQELDRLDRCMQFAVAEDQDIGATRKRLDAALTSIRRIEEQLIEANVSQSASIRDVGVTAGLVRSLQKTEMAANANDQGRRIFGDLYLGADTELADASATISYAEKLAACELPRDVQSWLFSADFNRRMERLRVFEATIATTIQGAQIAESEAHAVLKLKPREWCRSENFRTAPLISILEKAQIALAHPDAVEIQAAILGSEIEAREGGVGGVLDAFIGTDQPYERMREVIDFVFLHSAAEKLITEDPTLATHAGATHESLRKQFQDYDHKLLELMRQELAARLARRPIPPGSSTGPTRRWTDFSLLRHQSSLQRPSVNLRQLFGQAGSAIRALKPCVMMSPMSVAQYLAAGAHMFDILIVDEASQMRPEEAIGSLLRAQQAVIVGDPKQLPPTTFFAVQDDAQLDASSETADVEEESVLELGMRCWQPVRFLSWHYRSQHQSLIAFSNRRFYDEKLLVFPSPIESSPAYGVDLIEVSGDYRKGGRNEAEARTVVNAAAEFMRQHPERSLGIVAINQPQRDLIEQLMDELFATDPAAQEYRQRWLSELEYLFVKNLENVQGDERDVIFVSTVYGPDANGDFRQSFGPINLNSGYRRLNVLFTRAKCLIRIFTSMKAADIRIEPGSSEGVRTLKDYLEYAKTGRIDGVRPGIGEANEFEQWVIDKLHARGYEAVPQIGVSRFRIDIGVRHPDESGSFILGVECDGATYHSAKSARDRDKLRQMVLERLGWRIHRIWSTDWFRDPATEFERLVGRLEILRAQDADSRRLRN